MLSDPELVRRCVAVRERNGWPVARGPGEINTDYIEGMDPDGTPNQNRKNAFDDLHYGWIGLDITDQANLTGVVTGYAYNDAADGPILAGEVPEPSGLALLSLGAVGVLKRRK